MKPLHNGRARAVVRFPVMMLVGLGWIAIIARGDEAPPSKPVASSPPHERLVSPQVAAMLTAALPKVELQKVSKESPEREKTEADAGEMAGGPTLVMAPFQVTESSGKRRLLELVTRQQNQPKLPAFTFKAGGTILSRGPAALMFKYNPLHGGFDILNFKF